MPSEMTSAQRIWATYTGAPLDHLVRDEFSVWMEAVRRWRREGLELSWREILGLDHEPSEAELRSREEMSPEASPAMRQLLHFDEPAVHYVRVPLGGCEPPLFPEYERKVVERQGDYEVIQDNAGRLLKVFAGRRHGFMPDYLKHAVSSRSDWEGDVRPRLDVTTPERWAGFEAAVEAARRARAKSIMVRQSVIGGYMYLRSLIGPEDLLYKVHDDPDLIRDMMEQWLVVADATIAKVQARVAIDEIYLDEDICYNHGLLISPTMFRQFLLPYYQQMVANARARQANHVYFQVDTDGYAVPAIPLYLEAGMDVMNPFEVASGNDVVEIGRQYPNLVIIGGIDKRVLAAGKDAIRELLTRVLPPMVKRGRYIPMCDHGVPSDVSWESYSYYRLLASELDH
jgi:hypothetical protein